MRFVVPSRFEEMILLTVSTMDNAYPVSIMKKIQSLFSREVSLGSLQLALRRLEEKGYLQSYRGEASPQRCGFPKKHFRKTVAGLPYLD